LTQGAVRFNPGCAGRGGVCARIRPSRDQALAPPDQAAAGPAAVPKAWSHGEFVWDFLGAASVAKKKTP
jgi:hypothetical protein